MIPIVSAIVSTCNSERFIRGCLEDLEAQTIANQTEIIVVDSGSEQNERAIVQEFQERYDNIVYISTERELLYASWNRAIRIARGKYLTNANTDDRHRRDAFEVMARALDENPEAGMVYADCLITFGENETFGNNSATHYFRRPGYSLRQALLFCFFGCQPMWRRSAHEKVGMFNPEFRVAGDWEFFLRLARHLGALHIKEVLGLYLSSPGGIENRNPQRSRQETRRIRKHCRHIIPLEAIYPMFSTCEDRRAAEVACLLDQGNCCLLAGLPSPGDAIARYTRALELAWPNSEMTANLAVSIVWAVMATIRRIVTRGMPSAKPTPFGMEEAGANDDGTVAVKKLPSFMDHPVIRNAIAGQSLILEGSLLRKIESTEIFWRGPEMISPITGITHKGLHLDVPDENLEQLPRAKTNMRERPVKPSSHSPMVSVIVPTYNRKAMLKRCLSSIANQSYKDFEVIVVSDAGIDVSDIIKEMSYEMNIMYINHEVTKGVASARNTGIRVATGKYIAYLDDDDIYLPNHLEILVNFLETSNSKVAYTDACRVLHETLGENYVEVGRDIPFSHDFDYARMLVANFIPTLCIMHQRACLNITGLFDERLRALEDWDLWIRMGRHFSFAHIAQLTCEFSRRRDSSSITTGKQRYFTEATMIIDSKYRQWRDNEYPLVILALIWLFFFLNDTLKLPLLSALSSRLSESRSRKRRQYFDML